MAAQPIIAIATLIESELNPVRIGAFANLRALAWYNNSLYASRGYNLMRATVENDTSFAAWEFVGGYRPGPWRSLTPCSRILSRLVRDGFHALVALPSGHLIGAVPNAIVTLAPGETEFRESHKILRGTRPLHLATGSNGHIFWGEYFDNPQRDEVHIYASSDRGFHWDVAYTFPNGAIRHVHNIVYDEWANCFWVLTGDHGPECRILRASCDFKNVDVILSGSQQTRSAALVPTPEAVYFSTDTPLETNYVHRLDRRGVLSKVSRLSSSSIYGCSVGDAVFFSTMVEPSTVNRGRSVSVYGSPDGVHWRRVLQWKKDRWPLGLFQYGNAFLPDGRNTTDLLAVTTVAVENGDAETNIWRV